MEVWKMRDTELKDICKLIEDYCYKKGYYVSNIDIDVNLTYLHSMGESFPFAIDHIYNFKVLIGDRK